MRIPVLLTACVLLAGSRAAAQDLQYRMIMTVDMPAMRSQLDNMPTPVITIYMKGTKMRTDTQVPMGNPDPPALPEYMNMSVIVDQAAGRMFMLDHREKAYEEQPFKLPGGELDSVQQRALAQMKHTMTETKDTQTINGYAVKRSLMTMEMPVMPIPGAQPGGKGLMIIENWSATESALVKAYESFRSLVAAVQSPGPASAMLDQIADTGFPLRMTMTMLSIPDSGTYDVEKILKAGGAAEGLQMRMVTEIKDIKIAQLDNSLFEVPKDYRKK